MTQPSAIDRQVGAVVLVLSVVWLALWHTAWRIRRSLVEQR